MSISKIKCFILLIYLAQAMKKITSSGTFNALIDVLREGDDEQKTAVIQPLCNLVLNDGILLTLYNDNNHYTLH
jgi:hypothetical protein